MIIQAAFRPPFSSARRTACTSALNRSGAKSQLVDRSRRLFDEDFVPTLSSRGGRRELLRNEGVSDRKPSILVRFKGVDEMTREEDGRSGAAEIKRVLVIVAGAAGLAAAVELAREGHDVVVYEKSSEIGGVWNYTPDADSDPLSIDPQRKRVHSSMYASLRTNLPRELMGFLDFPFLAKEGRDKRRYPGYEEVNSYLRDFAEHHDLLSLIEFGVEVENVRLKKAGNGNSASESRDLKWIVRSNRFGKFNHEPQTKEDVFDAVLEAFRCRELAWVSNAQSQLQSSGIFPRQGSQIIVIIGNANSGGDISKELAEVAKEVHVERACEDGTVKFQDGKSTRADVILHCTGYLYSFPFLDTEGVVTVKDGRIDPLYKHVFVPAFGPTLSFVGLPQKIVPFPLFQAQSKWISKLLSGKVKLPSESTMMSDLKQFYDELEANGITTYNTHTMFKRDQFVYCDWILEQCGAQPLDSWREAIYFSAHANKGTSTNYRDDWKDQDLLDTATKSLVELSERLSLQVK
ncbi:hypothetical protein AXG93_509s1540 [Marchantia polymorpha subsp. ruderalis]|uniref:Flavin-containing monooxygenase n=1 Tax=Marchantia polymorpha subsp. ruderalis TaxID=1480154 RepID=A0A176WAR8_MARPO|nr:hypothetical protein AXG93_509s1540 [Marchantia polymorpha subsp. ruderalis]